MLDKSKIRKEFIEGLEAYLNDKSCRFCPMDRHIYMNELYEDHHEVVRDILSNEGTTCLKYFLSVVKVCFSRNAYDKVLMIISDNNSLEETLFPNFLTVLRNDRFGMFEVE